MDYGRVELGTVMALSILAQALRIETADGCPSDSAVGIKEFRIPLRRSTWQRNPLDALGCRS